VYSRSYYFSSVLVTIGTPETKESFERGKDKSRESGCEAETMCTQRGRRRKRKNERERERESERKRERERESEGEGKDERARQRRETRGRTTWVAGVARGAVRVLSPGESAEVGVEKRGKGLGN
jgi:uncharacterized membrane protein YdbT with pleckstrin-like domain